MHADQEVSLGNILDAKLSYEKQIKNIHKDFVAVNTVSLEGIGDVIEGISNMFSRRINAVVGFFGGNQSSNLESKKIEEIATYTNILKMSEYKVETIIRNKPLQTVLDTEVLVPLGFESDFLTAAKELSKSLDLIDKSIYVELDNLDTLIANMLTNEGVRISSRPVKGNSKLPELNKTLSKVLSTLIKPNSQTQSRKVRTLLPNVNKLREVHKLLEESSNIHSLGNLKQIGAITKNIRNKCEELYNLSNNNPGFRIKKETLVDLVKQMEDGAILVTNSSAIISLYIQVVDFYNLMLDRLNEL